MKKQLLKLSILIFSLAIGISSYGRNNASSESPVFALDSQFTYIKSLDFRYHNDELDNINETSIRAFIRELKEKRGDHYNFVVFRKALKPLRIKINPDTTISSQREYIEAEERKYAPTNLNIILSIKAVI